MLSKRFDRQMWIKRLAKAYGNNLADLRPAWIGNGLDDDFNAADETDVPNTFFIRFDINDNAHTYAYIDPTLNTQLFKNNMAVKVRRYYQNLPGEKIEWVIVGADEKMVGIQIGSTGYDPAGGYDNIVAHTHQNVDQGGQLDASFIFNGGRVSVQYGGTNNDLIDNPPVDGATFAYNLGAERIEPTSYEEGAILIGNNAGKPTEFASTASDQTIRSEQDGSLYLWRAVQNNFSASGAPTASDDNTLGYKMGSWWYDQANNAMYYCIDASTSNAVWQRIAPLNNMTATVNPTPSNDETEGYSVDSLWYNTVDQMAWRCISPNATVALWVQVWGYAPVPSAAINTVTDPTHTLTVTQYYIEADATSNTVVITLPPRADVIGRQFVIRRIDNVLANTVDYAGDGSDTINGAGSGSLTTQYQSVTLIAGSTEWGII